MKSRIFILSGLVVVFVILIGLSVMFGKAPSTKPVTNTGTPVTTTKPTTSKPVVTTTPKPVPITSNTVTVETAINESARAFDVRIIPLELLEDSRCPVNANCIQAGTVRVRTSLEHSFGTATQVFSLGVPITTEAEVIELVTVNPPPYAGERGTGTRPQYTFTFKVTRRQ